MKKFFKVLVLAPAICYILLSSILQEYQMVVAYRRSSVDFFVNCYRELGEAHQSGSLRENTALFRAARPEIKKWLKKYWRYRWDQIHSVTIEDIFQEGFISVVKYMRRYRFVCTVCGCESIYQADHDNHCEQEHEVKLEPQTKLSIFLSLNAMGRMRNVMRDLIRERRGLDHTQNETSLFNYRIHLTENFTSKDERISGSGRNNTIPEALIDRSWRPYREVLSRQRIEKFSNRLASDPSERVRAYLTTMLKGGSEADACRRMVELGLNKDTDSARGYINWFKKNKRFNRYRRDLTL